MMALAKALASSSGRLRICSANRWAVFGPTPGKRCSCSIRRAKGGV